MWKITLWIMSRKTIQYQCIVLSETKIVLKTWNTCNVANFCTYRSATFWIKKCDTNWSPFWLSIDTCRQLHFTIPNLNTLNLVIYPDKHSKSPWKIVEFILLHLGDCCIQWPPNSVIRNFFRASKQLKLEAKNVVFSELLHLVTTKKCHMNLYQGV